MKKNIFLFGVAAGTLAPLVAWLFSISSLISAAMHPLAPYVVAAAINLLLVRIFYRRGLDQCAYGVVLTTFVSLLLLIFTHKISLT